VCVYADRYRLSERERSLLVQAVSGVSDKLIADEWACSRDTIATYWKRIFVKTGCRPQRDVFAHLVRFVGSVDLETEGMDVDAQPASRTRIRVPKIGT